MAFASFRLRVYACIKILQTMMNRPVSRHRLAMALFTNHLKIFITLLEVIALCPAQNINDVATNFCQEQLGIDNFSCEPNEVGGVNCFNREEFCNNSTLCIGGEDEGNQNSFSRLQCE